MNEIVPNKNTYIDLTSSVLNEVSPNDAAYPVLLLSKSLETRFEQAQLLAKEVYRVVAMNTSIFSQVRRALKKGCRYVVDANESTIKAIESGKIKLSTDGMGRTFAQIRKANGKYGSNIPIKKESFQMRIDPAQMANALQMIALQEQLQEVADQINIIDHNVREVLQGQQNDRIGLYQSGISLFLESKNISEGEMKKALIAQALRALSEAASQLTLTMQSDIQYLLNKEYQYAKGKSAELIDDHMFNINRSFAFIHQATMLRAVIYCEQKELAAMATVFEEYSRFIENIIAKHAALLAQCDITDDGTEEGVWKSRARLKLDVSDFAKQLKTPDKTIYIGISKEN